LSLRGYVQLRDSLLTIDEIFETIGYPLEAYHIDHKDLRIQYPAIGLKLVIQFDIPTEEMKSYFDNQEQFNKLKEGAQHMELAALYVPLFQTVFGLLFRILPAYPIRSIASHRTIRLHSLRL